MGARAPRACFLRIGTGATADGHSGCFVKMRNAPRWVSRRGAAPSHRTLRACPEPGALRCPSVAADSHTPEHAHDAKRDAAQNPRSAALGARDASAGSLRPTVTARARRTLGTARSLLASRGYRRAAGRVAGYSASMIRMIVLPGLRRSGANASGASASGLTAPTIGSCTAIEPTPPAAPWIRTV